MYEQDLEDILQNDQLTASCFIGVYASDELPMLTEYPVAFILNTAPRSQKGEHWIALYYDQNKTCFFFDSFGQSPHFYNLVNYITSTSTNYYYNQKRIQGSMPYCGLYCIFFIRRAAWSEISKFLDEFHKDLALNDKLIFEKFKKL